MNCTYRTWPPWPWRSCTLCTQGRGLGPGISAYRPDGSASPRGALGGGVGLEPAALAVPACTGPARAVPNRRDEREARCGRLVRRGCRLAEAWGHGGDRNHGRGWPETEEGGSRSWMTSPEKREKG